MDLSNRKRRWPTALAAVALVAGGTLVAGLGSTASGATTFGPVNAALADGAANSLRDILENQVADGDTVVLQSGATYTLAAAGGDVNIKAAVTIQGNGATIRQTVAGERVLNTSFDLALNGVTITGGNAGGHGAGLRFEDDATTLVIQGSTFTANAAVGGGADAGAIDVSTSGATTVTVTNSTFSNNTSSDDGGAIDLETEPVTLNITASTFNHNSADDLGGAIASEDDNAAFTIVNSTITDNTSGEDGAIANTEGDGDDITLQYDTITNNIVGVAPVSQAVEEAADTAANATAGAASTTPPVQALQGEPASLALDGAFSSFATIITGPVGGENCDLSGATAVTSNGYNFSDDDTCGFTNTALGDRQNAGSPGLGALANNGGPTFTQLPQAGSPVIDQIPTGSPCGGVNIVVDQRGITRPQSTACEEGSVEVQVVTVVPRFTG